VLPPTVAFTPQILPAPGPSAREPGDMRRSVLSAARSCNALGWRERAPDLDRMSSSTTGTATDDPKSEQSRRDARTETIHASTCDLLRARPTAPGVPPSSAWLVRRIGCGPVQRGRGTGACAGVDGHRMAGVCRTSREVVNHQGGRRVDWRGWPATALRLDCEAQASPARGRKVAEKTHQRRDRQHDAEWAPL
jgi:hypothetical protein